MRVNGNCLIIGRQYTFRGFIMYPQIWQISQIFKI